MSKVIYNGKELADNDVRNPFSEKNIKLRSRYGHSHTLKYSPEEGENVYQYIPAEDWMPMRYGFDSIDEDAEVNELMFLDPDGGPFLDEGSEVMDGKITKKVKRLYSRKNVGFFIEFEDSKSEWHGNCIQSRKTYPF